ncbi:MAG TPA: FtsX-like permease family protein, partial [Acidothermaceae bacterium]|nr:FtsX-like permease family protein [Acidothermaceae bacterium]
MGFVRLRYRAELRARWLLFAGLATLVGIGGGVTLTAFAGARRTDAAVPDFLAYSRPDDGGFLYGNIFSPPVESGAAANSLALAPAERQVIGLPQVVAHFRAPYLFMTLDRTGQAGNLGGGAQRSGVNTIGVADRDLFRRVDRPMVLSGRLPRPSAPFDVAINELTAEKQHLHVGSRVHLFAYSAAQSAQGALTNSTSRPERPEGPAFTVRVRAVLRFPQDVSAVGPVAAKQDVSYEGQQNLYLTPAFLPRLAAGLGIPVQAIPDINLVGVRLRHGAGDFKPFAAAARRVGQGAVTVGEQGNVSGATTAAASAQRGVHLEVVALLAFGVLAALVTLLLVGQAINRQTQLDASDRATFRSLGATSGQLAGVVVVRTAVIAVAGATIAFAVAVLASPLMPLGLARQADLHPGFSVDLTVLVPGAIAIALLVTATAAGAVWRIRRHASPVVDLDDSPTSPSRLGRALAPWSGPPTAVIGVRYALTRGRGHSSVPVVAALTSTILAVAVVAGAVTFSASLNHLVDTPRQQGWNWDVLVGNPNDTGDHEAKGAALLAHNPLVESYSAVAILAGAGQGNVSIHGVPLDTFLAIDPLRGSVHPPLLEGRAPHGTHEIVLGSHTLRQLHQHVGQTIRTATPAGPVRLHIVGRMIAPSVGDLFTNHLGDGGWVSGALARQIAASQPQDQNGLPPTVFNLFAVRYAPGVARHAAFASLKRDFGATVLHPLPAEDVVNLRSVDQLPLILAALIALLATVTLANTLVSAVRRRRHDLAILKTVGFVRRQIAGVVVWQATTFALVALAVGIPLGLAGGRWAWNAVASGIGAVSPPVLPTALVALLVLATVVVANLVAVVPG